MSSYLRPRRGKYATAVAQLTAANPLKRGEVFFEVPDDGVGTGKGKIKMGDGVTAYEDLPYFNDGTGSGGGTAADVSLTLSSSNWTSETISGTTYKVQTVACAGASSSIVPIIVPIYSTDAEIEAYSNIIRVEPGANTIKFIAVDTPSTNLVVVAKFSVESIADLDNINTMLNQALTANVVGTEVNLNSYTSVDAPYTCPNDGYVILTVGGSVATAVECKINNAIVLTLKGNGSDTVHNATFVRKGMTIYCNGATVDSNRIVSYMPLQNS